MESPKQRRRDSIAKYDLKWAYLQRNDRIHTREKVFAGSICAKGFSDY